MRQRRAQLRERRHKASVPTVALVGYTNAGKTTLFNVLTRADAEASERAVRHARSAGAAGAAARQPRAARVRHRRLHRSAAARAGGGVSRHARGSGRRRSGAARHRRGGAGPRSADDAPSSQVLEEVGAIDVPLLEVYNKCDALTPDERRRLQDQDPGGVVHLGAARGRASTSWSKRIASRLALDVRRVTLTFDPDDAGRSRADRPASTATAASLDARNARRPGVDRRRRAAPPARSAASSIVECKHFPRCDSARLLSSLLLRRSPPARVRAEAGRRCRSSPRRSFPSSSRRSCRPAFAGHAAAEHHDRGWAFLQAGDLKSAEREFAAALKAAPAFYPAEAALGYVELARKDPKAALPHFDRALERQAERCVGAGRTRAGAARARTGRPTRWRRSRPRWPPIRR